MQDKQFDVGKKQFGLFFDQTGIWQCGGRLGMQTFPIELNTPYFSVSSIFLTKLIVRNARVCHAQWSEGHSNRSKF